MSTQNNTSVTENRSVLFRLEHFEWLVHHGTHEEAARALITLLQQLNSNYSSWGASFTAHAPLRPGADTQGHICTRIAGAVTTLFSSPGFTVSDEGYARLMDYHRWLALIFAVSGYQHGDHIIRNINASGGGQVDPLTLNAGNLKLFCLSYYPDSLIALQPDALWQYDRKTVVRLFFSLLSGRALPTREAHEKREILLAWLPEKLKEVDTLGDLPCAVLHDVYMHCSYADLPGKHLIKREINRLTARTLQQNFPELLPVPAPESDRKKPVVLVILEWFTSQHSIYRTHSTSMRALRKHFTLCGVGQEKCTDDITRQVFDEWHEVSSANAVAEVLRHIHTLKPDIIYYPSVGMFPLTVYLTSLRLAPLQLMALGHPATTWSPHIDGVLVEEDYLGDEACFSEPVYPVPADAIPYIPPASVARVPVSREPFRERARAAWPAALPVRVAICASVMKINPGFLETLREIGERSQTPVQFCFYMGFAAGLTFSYLKTVIREVLPTAEVNAHMPVAEYQKALNSCELFLNPFPFGNTNGLVDTVRQGMPGVCMTGPEVHTHIDEGLFRRLSLPESLIARNREEYIRAALSLTDTPKLREKLQKQLTENDVEQVLFHGAPEKFADRVYDIWQTRCSGNARAGEA